MTVKNLHVARAFGPKTITTSTDGSTVDLSGDINPGGRDLLAHLNVRVSTGTTISITVKVQDSTTTTAADFTDISGAVFTVVATTTGSEESIYFHTNKRYVRVVVTFGTDMTSSDIAAEFVASKRMV